MKRFFFGLAVVAVAVCLAIPAMADLKMTTKGYMNVKGLYLDGNILNVSNTIENKSSDAWYQMEMVIEPTFHVNDKVRLHSRVTIMERVWRGGHGAEFDTNNFGVTANRGGNYRSEHNFWWEQLYMSFPLFDGTLSVGRMSGGAWGFPFQDSESNRDRIKYVRKVGNITLLGLVEKLGEGDGAQPLTLNPTPTDAFTNSYSDTEAYAVGAVVPFSKDIVWRPLVYYIEHQQANTHSSGYTLYISNALGLKIAPFFLDAEVNYWNRKFDNFFNPGDLKGDQWAGWLDTGMNMGPAQFAVGGFYLQGENDVPTAGSNPKRQSLTTVGEEFQPLFLLFSEDVGLLWNTSGVANRTVGTSGYWSFYARGAYNLSDTMKITGIYAYLMADKMPTPTGANKWDKEIGHEIDLGFEWKLMDNLTYKIDAGYLIAGKYFNDSDSDANNDLSNDVFGMRHMLEIKW